MSHKLPDALVPIVSIVAARNNQDLGLSSRLADLYHYLNNALAGTAVANKEKFFLIPAARTVVCMETGWMVQMYDQNEHPCVSIGRMSSVEGHNGHTSYAKTFFSAP